MPRSHQSFRNQPAGLCLLVACLILSLHTRAGVSASPAQAWVYLRDGKPPAAAESLVEIIATGDVMPGRGLAGTPGMFEHVAAQLRGADLVIGNLEGVLLDDLPDQPAGTLTPGYAQTPLDYPPVLRTPGVIPRLFIPTAAVVSLAGAGFDVLSLANNHSLDAGPEGLAGTARLLTAAGIQPLESARLVVRTLGGLKIALLSWNEIPASSDEALLAALRAARPQADFIILLLHWGQEYQRQPLSMQSEQASRLFEAGVDVILGAHPHVVQPVQVLQPEEPAGRTRLVAYSLGNFVFDQGWEDTRQGLALRLYVDRQGLRAAQALPLWNTPRPRWMDAHAAASLLERILPAERTGFACSEQACRPIAVPQQSRSGLFWSGAIDLTGDGRREIIRRQGQTVEIFQDGQPAWRSPPEWRVIDLALGDPNDDGRYELLLALQKTSPSGDSTSHPFIVGYRGGIYRLVWGGSQVSATLFEVELGDLDGDGLDELAAIEASEDGSARYLTVWRWHGWGFSLLWRSPAGDYHDLILLPAEQNQPPRLSVVSSSP